MIPFGRTLVVFFSYALDWFGMEKVEQKRKTTCTSKLLRIEEINA